MANQSYLEYLKKLDKIVIPNEFTYFVHNTLFGKNEKKFEEMWEKIPIDTFTVKREMSFVERNSRVEEALDYGSLKKAKNSYTVNPRGKNFQIRVIMPKRFLSPEQLDSLEITPEEKELLEQEYRGLGDMRHPKLKNGEKIYIFASSTEDEISNENIDILYGIREQDIERYAKLVQKILQQESVQLFELPDRTKNGLVDRETAQSDYFEAIKTPYILKRDPDLSRYTRTQILDQNGNVQLIGFSEFEEEFIKEKGIYPKTKEEGENQQGNDTNTIASFEEMLNEQYGDIIESTEILQIQDKDLLQKLRIQNCLDPLQTKIEFYFVDITDKENEEYNGIGVYMRDRTTGKIKQVKLPISEEITDDQIIDWSKSAKSQNGMIIPSISNRRMGSWKLFDGSIITAFRDNNGEMHIGKNDSTNNKFVNPISTS